MDRNHVISLLASKVGNLSDIDASVALVEALEYMLLATSQAGPLHTPTRAADVGLEVLGQLP